MIQKSSQTLRGKLEALQIKKQIYDYIYLKRPNQRKGQSHRSHNTGALLGKII